MIQKDRWIEVEGARTHNLKNIDVRIPRHALVVITGLSGSGKSSLAFDTIYAEGQRRYIECFSAYARQFLGGVERPDVDRITGLSPVISIEQKTTNKNPRSTVGTVTEVYDFLRLLFARAGTAYSFATNEPMVRFTEEQIVQAILSAYSGKRILILAPVVKGRKGHYRDLFEKIAKNGYFRVRVDGEVREIKAGMKLDRYKVHDIEVLIDTLEVVEANEKRMKRSLADALKMGKGSMLVVDPEEEVPRFFSKMLMCPTTGIAYDDPAPNLFSFNSPYGACSHCNGLGKVLNVDHEKVFPSPEQSLRQGGIAPLGKQQDGWIYGQLETLLAHFEVSPKSPVAMYPEELIRIILRGTNEPLLIKNSATGGTKNFSFEGIGTFLQQQLEEDNSPATSRWARKFMEEIDCPECMGARLKKESLYYRIDGMNIVEMSALSIQDLQDKLEGLEDRMDAKGRAISTEILKEVRKRIGFLLDVGLSYLNLSRPSKSLSGGEAQRIRLATQIGSQLVGVLYILDEPSIGLHQRDNMRLIAALQKLRDAGNSVLVVEHDKDMMLASDYILDIGPGAGRLGGEVIAAGTPEEFLESGGMTAAYLRGDREISMPEKRRKGNKKHLILEGATGHNLKGATLKIPLNTLTCVTGVSGSGKSSLINETLYPALANLLHQAELSPLPYKQLKGVKHIDKVIRIDQSPIGRTPRSNPATYTGVFTEIRSLFSAVPEAQIRGYKPGRFSFNVKGGRCETCGGAGVRVIEMNFLPNVEVRCETCQGKRYNRETLEVRYKGKSISDVLEMRISEAVIFFESIPQILRRIKVLDEIGLGYLTLGQSSTTLSGGEAQRVKLAAELNRPETGNTLYLLDEPTTGLHFEDVRVLLEVVNRLVDKGNTVLVIEHNMDIIKSADYLIDVGPEGGESGGEIIFSGSPEDLMKKKDNFTGFYLYREVQPRNENVNV